MGVPENILQNGPEYVTHESMIGELRAVRHDVTYLQRLHKAQVTHLDESNVKTEAELSALRSIVSALSRALFDAGITSEDMAAVSFAKSTCASENDEANSATVVGFAEGTEDKPVVSADLVMNDGVNAPSRLHTGPEVQMASEVKLSDRADQESMQAFLEQQARQVVAGVQSLPVRRHFPLTAPPRSRPQPR